MLLEPQSNALEALELCSWNSRDMLRDSGRNALGKPKHFNCFEGLSEQCAESFFDFAHGVQLYSQL